MIDEMWRKNHGDNDHIPWVHRGLDTLTGYFNDRTPYMLPAWLLLVA